MTDPVPMGLPPGGAAFVQGQPRDARTLQVRAAGPARRSPRLRRSIRPASGCGGDDLEVVPLARRGTVQTFVVNQTMPPPFVAPLPLLVLDLDDGARLMVQGTPDDAPSHRDRRPRTAHSPALCARARGAGLRVQGTVVQGLRVQGTEEEV